MNTTLAKTLEYIKAAAIACETQPRFAACPVNGHTVTALVAEGYRNSGAGKVSIRWSVDGKRVAAADIAKALA